MAEFVGERVVAHDVLAAATAAAQSREDVIVQTFVDLVDTTVEGFDVVAVLGVLAARCVELLGAAAVGILLIDAAAQPRVISASDQQVERLELLQIESEQGPSVDCLRTGLVVADADLATSGRWPSFAEACVAAGYSAVCVVPLRLRDVTIGCVNLFIAERGALADGDVELARALLNVAAIAVVQGQATRASDEREAQLRHALNSRVVIEQAKGMIAQRADVDVDEAFSRMRAFARSNNRGLTKVASDVVARRLTIGAPTTSEVS